MTETVAQSASMGHHQWIPLTKLSPSPLNHRKRFDKAKLEELANSIRAQGVIQPVVVRPLEDAFEIVAGERRFRAAKLAKLIDLPAIVRDLSDDQVIELQVVENGQREDVHPLEEAEGYEALMKHKRADGTTYTVEEIANKVGKSKGTVYARLKLTALCKKARDAMYDGKLDPSRALLIARIPIQDLQEQALEAILTQGEYWDGEHGSDATPMTYREAAEHVQQNYMLQLKGAPFKTGDPDLVASAGACTNCPKRTGNQPELFGDVKSADVCTDPKCFSAKKSAHVIKLREAAKASGKEVISGKEAKKLIPHEHSDPKGYQPLAKSIWVGNDQKTVKQVLGKDCPDPVLIENPHTGELMECVREADAAPLLKAKLPKEDRASGDSEERWKKEQRERERKTKLEREIRRSVYFGARDQVATAGLGLEDLRLIAASFWERLWHDAKKVVAPYWFPEAKADGKKKFDRLEAITKKIPTMSVEDLIRLLLDCALAGELMSVSGYSNDRATLIATFAERHKVDAAKIRRDLTATAKAAAEDQAARKKRKAAPAKKKTAKK